MGGIYVESFHDISIMLAPVTRDEALKMIAEIKGFSILKGSRGIKGANLADIATTIVRVSNLMMDEDRILELDLNPCFAGNKCTVVDYRVIVG
jgi:acyl-CoA synthetase (NDP forming)